MNRLRTQSDAIESARQVRGLRAPARQEIVDALQSMGPSTIAELGAELGRAPDSLYYHVKAMLKLGLIVECDAEGLGKRGLVIDVAHRPMQIRYRPKDGAQVRALQDVVGAMLRLTGRDFSAGLASPEAVVDGPHRTVWAARSQARLSKAKLARLNALLTEAIDLMSVAQSASLSDAEAARVALTFVVTPLPRRRREDEYEEPRE